MLPVSLIQYQSAPFNGPFSADAVVAATAVPFESVWIPTAFSKYASIDVEGKFDSLSVQMLGSNSIADPGNISTITVGGSATTGDVSTLTFNNPNLPAGLTTVAHTTIGGDSTATIATALAAAINASAALQGIGMEATAASTVITINYPSYVSTGQTGPSPSQPAYQNSTLVTGLSNGSASETFTVANASVGNVLGAAITALGLVAITTQTRWIKAVYGTLTGTNAIASVNYHGAA